VTPPLVSILLPAFDAAATLPACLRSIARQSEPRWECVIVDDGSRDATLPTARAFAARDPRFRVLARPHAGIVTALNTGITSCRAALIARMDADDLMHRRRLAEQVRALAADASLTAVGTHVRLFPRAGLRPGRRAYERWLNGIASAPRVRADAFVECPVAHPTLMIRADTLRGLGYRERGWPEDYDLVLRILAGDGEIGVVPRRLVSWRDRPARLSRTAPAYALERFTACKAAFLASGLLAESPRYVLWGYGETGRALRRALATHGKEPVAIVELHPGRIGNRIAGAPVIPPAALTRLPRTPIVAAVAGPDPRRQIRAALERMGFTETRDFICAA